MQGVSQMALRYLFWVLLGFACLGFVKFGVITFFVIIAVLIALVLIGRRHTDVLGEALKSLAEGARHALPVAVACALVGDRKSTRLNSSHVATACAVFCLEKKYNT